MSASFAAAGLAYRRRPDVHKRLMMLATIAILPPAVGRAFLWILGVVNPVVLLGAPILFLGALAVQDRRTRGRIHPITLWEGLLLILSQGMSR